MTTVEGMSASMHLLGPLNLIVPFLAHVFRCAGSVLRCCFSQGYRGVLRRCSLFHRRHCRLIHDSRSVMVYCPRSNRGLLTDGVAGIQTWQFDET